jgi:predicted alpha/beta-fold hydrolase
MVEFSFRPHPLLRNAHLMTIIPALRFVPGSAVRRSTKSVLADVSEDSKVLLHCHLDGRKPDAPILVLVHGLEGSSAAPYLISLTEKALSLGCGVVRMNMRNCGGTLHLTPTLYNAGMSADVIAVVDYVRVLTGSSNIFVVGYSLGGNVVLKAAAELGAQARDRISGVCAVSPALDLERCVRAIEKSSNKFYEIRFLIGLKQKIREKSRLFPQRFDASKLKEVTSIRLFDELFTAPDAGYEGALDYYRRASSLGMLERVETPTLIVTAQDDPIVPFESFQPPHFKSSKYITLLAPSHGGHGGFVSELVERGGRAGSDRQWAENRVLEFCLDHSSATG